MTTKKYSRRLVFWYQTLDPIDGLVVKWKWDDDGLYEHVAQIPKDATTSELQQWFKQHFGNDVVLTDDRRIDFHCDLQTPKSGEWFLVGPNPGLLSPMGKEFARMSDALMKTRAELEAVRKQLPEGMEHCTIRFIKCPDGHGRLTATNWVDNGCPHCDLEAARAANEQKNATIKKMSDELRPITFQLEQDLSISPHWRVKWKQQDGAVGAFECICLACPEKNKELARLKKELVDLQFARDMAVRELGGVMPGDEDEYD
jgi:hypothetical protein